MLQATTGNGVGFVDALTIALAASAFVLSLMTVVLPWLRRPDLSILIDREHSHVEREGTAAVPYLRVPVYNGKWRRSAKRARVVLDRIRRVDGGETRRLGSPFLAWPSVFGQESDAYVDVLFPGTERPVGIGRFYPTVEIGQSKQFDSSAEDARWWLKLELPGNYTITEQRDLLPPGKWAFDLVVGADDGDAHAYTLTVGWPEAQGISADDLLSAVLASMTIQPTD